MRTLYKKSYSLHKTYITTQDKLYSSPLPSLNQKENLTMSSKPHPLGKFDTEKFKKGEWVSIDIENWGNCMKCDEKTRMLEMFYCMDCTATFHPLCLDEDAYLYDDPRYQFWKCSICEEKEKNKKIEKGVGGSASTYEESNKYSLSKVKKYIYNKVCFRSTCLIVYALMFYVYSAWSSQETYVCVLISL